ncbi:MAG: hypothetical protein CSA89_00760 [Bacteroidales bacterium]|nr:MAG: hypothetical protein CSA89_00760 [Bacteroidales bacterium]
MLKNRKLIIVLVSMFLMSACSKEACEFYPKKGELKQEQTQLKSVGSEYLDPFLEARREFFAKVLKVKGENGKPYTMDELYAISLSKSVKDVIARVPKDEKEFRALNLPRPPKEATSIDYTPVISEDKEPMDYSPESFGLIGKIQGLVMEAKVTGDDTKFIRFLRSNDLYDIYQDIVKKYMIEERAGEESLKACSGYEPVTFDNLKSNKFIDGDVFVKYDDYSSNSSNNSSSGSSSGSNFLNWIIPGHWGHGAFLDVKKRQKADNYFLLSASNEVEQGGTKVGYDKVDGYWSIATEVAVCRVKNQSQYRRRASIEYSKQFIGRDFTFFCKRMTNSHFYCSKVVYRGWLSQGVELEPHDNWFTIYKFWRWNYKKKWGIKWWYPEFKAVKVKDFWVTPSDLYNDNDVKLIQKFKS